MDIKKKVISEEQITFETPPDRDALMEMTDDELEEQMKKLRVPRSQIEGIQDKEKCRKFMIEENLRLRPPFPPPVKPVLIDSEYDQRNMNKIVKFRYVKHIIDSKSKKYSHSVITVDSYVVRLQSSEVALLEKENLLNSIKGEVSRLNLNDYTSKDDIMKFACDNGKSNGEKRKRAVMLQKALQKNNYGRHRITTYDISVY